MLLLGSLWLLSSDSVGISMCPFMVIFVVRYSLRGVLHLPVEVE